MENQVNGHDQQQPQENGVEEGEQREGDQPARLEKVVKKIRVTYEEYRTIANLLILHLRQLEESSDEGKPHPPHHLSVTCCRRGYGQAK